jgi:hypothetical protein
LRRDHLPTRRYGHPSRGPSPGIRHGPDYPRNNSSRERVVRRTAQRTQGDAGQRAEQATRRCVDVEDVDVGDVDVTRAAGGRQRSASRMRYVAT